MVTMATITTDEKRLSTIGDVPTPNSKRPARNAIPAIINSTAPLALMAVPTAHASLGEMRSNMAGIAAKFT